MNKFLIWSLSVLFAFTFSQGASAKDVVTEQHNVAVAQRILEKAQADYDVDVDRVRLLKERIAQQQAQLAEAEKKVEVSRKSLAQAKEEYGKQQKILEQAWKNK